jgi:arabinofuranan 3-O-arabinosyltransferase
MRRAGVLLVLAALLLVLLLLNKLGVLAPDIKPEIYMAPWREAESLNRAWRESPKLGEPNFNVGLFPVAWAVGLIQQLGVGPDLSMRLLRWMLLVLGAWGATRFYALVAGSQVNRTGRVAMAVLYVANPYMVTAGDFLAIVLPAALLPWMALFILRATVQGGWGYPAAAALAFAAMSGMNVAVIPLIQLLCLPALLWYARWGLGATWRQVWTATARWALLAALLSAYWLVPSLAALGAGSHVTQFSESLEGIAGPSSFGEVIRGLGLWPLYGSDGDGPWQPGFTSYLTNPLIIVASFLLPILLVVSAQVIRGPARRLVLLLVIPAAVLMVGVHPADQPTPFGHLLLWTFENVPGAAAFRTTNKVGAVLVLGVALIGALAAPTLLQRARRIAPRPVVMSIAATGVVLATWPAWTGGLYSLPLPVPSYWYEAAATLDEGPQDQRVWFVPGVAQPQYTWSEDRPDDLNNALLARPSFVRITLPESSPYGASLLAAVDTGLQEGTLPTGTLSAAARYLGVGDILVRNDVRWEKAGGARPVTIATQVGSDPGLRFRGSDGEPGEGLLRTDDQPAEELGLPPLQRYGVLEPRDLVRTESGNGLVVVDGDGWALGPLVQAGLLPSEPPYVLMGDVDSNSLAQMLGSQRRIVITDSNRRREVIPNRLTGAYGALQTAEQDPGSSIALFGPGKQTVLRVVGGQVSATQVGPRFGVSPSSSAENAFDGDPTTAWTFGDFGRGLGQSVTLRASRAVAVDRVDLDIPPTKGQRIARVQVTADDAVREVAIPDDGRASVRFPGRRATRITLTVTEVDGVGDNPLSVAEVSAPGLEVRRVARLPLSTTLAAQKLDATGKARLARTPLDVVMSRVQGRVQPGDDEEKRIDRDFTLPDRREYRVYGLVRPDAGAPEPLLDALQGVTGEVVVESSSRAFNGVLVRGSRAFDGDPNTGWVPGRGIEGEWVNATFPRRSVSRVVINQPADASSWISSADLLLDGRRVTSAQLAPGRVVVPVPEVDASSLRLRVTGFAGEGLPMISEIDVAGAKVVKRTADAANECVRLATVDGAPLRVRIIGGVEGDGPRMAAGCDPLRLGPGEHRIRSVPGWTADSLVLRDTIGEAAVQGQPGPPLTVKRKSSSVYRMTAPAASEPYLLVVGQNVHGGWRATMDGVDLGPPVPVDGYALGWWVRDLDPHVFVVEYAPQRAGDVALAVSGASVLICALLLLRLPRMTGSRVGHTPSPPIDGSVVASSPSGRWRTRLGWFLFVLGCLVFGGIVGLSAGIAAAAWCLVRPPLPRTLLWLSAATMGLVPVAWIVGNLNRWGEVSPQLVLGNPAPSVLVVVALVLLVIGSWREVTIKHTAGERAQQPY